MRYLNSIRNPEPLGKKNKSWNTRTGRIMGMSCVLWEWKTVSNYMRREKKNRLHCCFVVHFVWAGAGFFPCKVSGIQGIMPSNAPKRILLTCYKIFLGLKPTRKKIKILSFSDIIQSVLTLMIVITVVFSVRQIGYISFSLKSKTKNLWFKKACVQSVYVRNVVVFAKEISHHPTVSLCCFAHSTLWNYLFNANYIWCQHHRFSLC